MPETSMAELTTVRHAEGLISQTDQLADLVQDADMRRRVPSCPDWNLRELVEHIGRGHRSGLDLIRGGFIEPVLVDPALIPVPADDELGGWLRAGARELVDTVREAGADRPVWNYLGFDMHAGFWLRRMGHDTAVHRFDACLTLERPFALDADLAADGVSEWLTVVNSPGAAAMKPEVAVEMRGTGQTLHLHATDQPGPGEPTLADAGEWLIRRDPDGVSWEYGHGEGDVAVRGLASDLLLALLGRIRLDDPRLEILGDRGLIEHWVRHVTF
jgi:uncharacterized protein (TIGR03083 family)